MYIITEYFRHRCTETFFYLNYFFLFSIDNFLGKITLKQISGILPIGYFTFDNG